jgi:hypothetical protein
MLHATSHFVYVRLHGAAQLYTSGYSDRALTDWARRIRRWSRAGRDVYVYFDNDVKVRAPFDALNLMRKLGLEWPLARFAHRVSASRRTAGARPPRLPRARAPRPGAANRARAGLPRWAGPLSRSVARGSDSPAFGDPG